MEIAGKMCLIRTLIYNARIVIYGITLSARRFPTICLNFWRRMLQCLVPIDIASHFNKSMAKVLQNQGKMQERQDKLEGRQDKAEKEVAMEIKKAVGMV